MRNIDYSMVIELDNVTLEDCLDLYKKKGIFSISNDGRLINFTKDTNCCFDGRIDSKHKRHKNKIKRR